MANQTLNSIAKKLAKARKDKGLTQAELGDLLGVPQSYVARVENGKSDLRTSRLIEIARLLDLELLFVPKTLVATLMNLQEEWDEETPKRDSAYRPDELDDSDEEVY